MSTINPNISQIIQKSSKDLKPLEYYLKGIIEEKNQIILAEAITLLESSIESHKKLSESILKHCFPLSGKSKRVGITGSPGVGKSSFIEKIAGSIIGQGSKLAVLTIDPTSTDNRGSILGDKTRMDNLSKNPNVFIRPSPSKSHLGGTHIYTYEAIIMCEAAGIDYIMVETVGVGQSEHEVKSMVDCTLLLLLPGAGDDLQGIKKGITQISDIVIINKADGERVQLAENIQKDYQAATHLSRLGASKWQVPVIKFSSLTGQGSADVIDAIHEYFIHVNKNGFLIQNRSLQEKKWLLKRVEEYCTETIRSLLLSNVNIEGIMEHRENVDQTPFDLLNNIKRKLKIDLKFR